MRSIAAYKLGLACSLNAQGAIACMCDLKPGRHSFVAASFNPLRSVGGEKKVETPSACWLVVLSRLLVLPCLSVASSIASDFSTSPLSMPCSANAFYGLGWL